MSRQQNQQRPHYARRALAVFATMVACTESFVPMALQRATVSSDRCDSTYLGLLPQQGKQLVAAYEASTCEKQSREGSESNGFHPSEAIEGGKIEVKKNGASSADQQQQQRTPTGAARAFVSRVFKLPSNIRQHYNHAEDEVWDNAMSLPKIPGDRSSKAGGDDVVLYPVVGFRIVEDEEHHSRVLPTKSNVSCRLPNNYNEDVFGWYSPACRLDLYKEDPCEAPEDVEPLVHP